MKSWNSARDAVMRKWRRFRTLRIAFWLAIAVAVYALIGFLIAPPLAKWRAEVALKNTLAREVTIERIAFNPFTLAVAVHGLHVSGRDGLQTAVAFDALYLRLSYASAVHLAPVIARLRLEQPYIHLVRRADKTYSFQDLIEKWRKQPASGKPPTRFSLNNVRVVGGRIDFDDRPEGLKHRITDVRIDVPFVSNFDADVDIEVTPSVRAVVNGDPFALVAETKPFQDPLESHFTLKAQDVALARYLDYSPVPLAFHLASGKLDAQLEAVFRRQKGQRPALSIGGSLRIRDLAVATAKNETVASFERLEVVAKNVEPLAGRAEVERIALSAPMIDVRRAKDGSINLLELVPAASAAPAREPVATTPARAPGDSESSKRSTGAPFAFQIGELIVEHGTVRLEDQVPAQTFRTQLQQVAVRVEGLSNALGAHARAQVGFEAPQLVRMRYDGSLDLRPLAAAGTLTLDGLRLARLQPYYAASVAGEVAGTLDASAHIDLAMTGDKLSGGLSKVKATTHEFTAGLPGETTPILRIASVQLAGGDVDLGKRRVTLGELAVRKAEASLRRAQDGTLDAQRMLKNIPAATARTQPGANRSSANQSGTNPWTAVIERIDIAASRIALADQAVDPHVQLRLGDVALSARNVGNDPNMTTKLSGQATVNGGGSIAWDGSATAQPSAKLTLKLKGIDLLPFRPYVPPQVALRFSSARLSGDGKLAVDAIDPLRATYHGSVEIADFNLPDAGDGGTLLKWNSLRASGIEASTTPQSLSIEEIAVADLDSRLILSADGKLNLVQQLKGAAAGEPKTADAGGTKTGDAAGSGASRDAAAAQNDKGGEALDWLRIGRVTARGAKVHFTDLFVQPNYSAKLTDIVGSVSTLAADRVSEVNLDGQVEGAAPFALNGKVKPLARNLFLDLKGKASGVALPPLSPYAIKYLGYRIKKGKLSLDVAYHVEDRKLTASNDITLDQLTFGERVESPTATQLPVLLALDLLKDSHGVVNVHVPISGSLDDPRFKVSDIAVDLIFKLIKRTVTAPFALLGKLVGAGAGEELDYVAFDPGRAALSEEAIAKLDKLGKALKARPNLKLNITGWAGESADRLALQRVGLEQRLQQPEQGSSQRAGKAPAPAKDTSPTRRGHESALARAYRGATRKSRRPPARKSLQARRSRRRRPPPSRSPRRSCAHSPIAARKRCASIS